MKTLLCSVPDGPVEKASIPLFSENANMPPLRPLGILRLMYWMEQNDYTGELYDINNLRPSDEEMIEVFKKSKPDVVGLSAVLSHCYPNTKRITKILRKLFPNVWIVVGGHMSSSANVILHKTETDICVVGDGEIPMLELLKYFEKNNRNKLDYKALEQIGGLAFLDVNNNLKVTGFAKQLSTADMKYTDFDKLKEALRHKSESMDDLFPNIEDCREVMGTEFYKPNLGKKIGYLDTSKGCVARCTFCQRSTKGYKAYEVTDLEAHLIELKKKLNVGGIFINDENFGSDKKQAYEIARIIKKVGLFWMTSAVRAKSVSYESLKFYKEHNCIYMAFGIETGSQKILDIMEKKSTTDIVYNAVSNCVKLGIYTSTDALMIGMPGETSKTIKESARFVASLRHVSELDWNVGKPYWAMAIPGTPLYEYCQQIGIIGETLQEEEDYLIRTAEQKTNFLNYLNKTDSNIQEVYFWNYLYDFAGKKAFLDLILKNKKNFKEKIIEIYNKCFKGEIRYLLRNLKDLYHRSSTYKHGGFLQRVKWLSLLIANFTLSVFAIILPKFILYPIIRAYSDLRFFVLKRKYKVKNGKQKYNVFTNHDPDLSNKFRINEQRLTYANEHTQRFERSLRTIVKRNREQMKPPVTDQEKGLRILHQGQ